MDVNGFSRERNKAFVSLVKLVERENDHDSELLEHEQELDEEKGIESVRILEKIRVHEHLSGEIRARWDSHLRRLLRGRKQSLLLLLLPLLSLVLSLSLYLISSSWYLSRVSVRHPS